MKLSKKFWIAHEHPKDIGTANCIDEALHVAVRIDGVCTQSRYCDEDDYVVVVQKRLKSHWLLLLLLLHLLVRVGVHGEDGGDEGKRIKRAGEGEISNHPSSQSTPFYSPSIRPQQPERDPTFCCP